MLAMAIKAISVAGMGRAFKEEKEIHKLQTLYELVRFAIYSQIVFLKLYSP